MSRRLGLQLALRYAFGRARALSAIGAMATAGLALSVAVLVIVISVINGFERELRERVLGLLPHVSLLGRSPIDANPALRSQLASRAGVASVRAVIEAPALLATDSAQSAILLSGVEPDDPATRRRLQPFLEASESLATALPAGDFGVVLGAAVAAQLQLSPGDSVTLVLPQASVSIAGLLPRQKRLQVTGIVRSRSELDSRTAYVNLADAGRLLRLGGRIHGYQLTLVDLFAAQDEASDLHAAYVEQGLYTRNWFRTHGNLYRAIVIQKQTMFILLAFLIAVAAFNLISSLLMVGKQRSGDIAILSTLGAPPSTFRTAFALLGVFVGGIGIAAGLIIGVGIAAVLPWIYRTATEQLSLNLMAEYFVNYLPVDIRWGDLVGIASVSLALALLSALFPAWRLTKVQPTEILAHE
jgi:lipoprotein-releasing system permease protein